MLWKETIVFSLGTAEPAWLSREVSSAKGGLGSRRGGQRQLKSRLQHGFLENAGNTKDLARLLGLWKERALFWSLEAPEKFITT